MPGETLRVWRLRVTNERVEAAEISAFSFVEFAGAVVGRR